MKEISSLALRREARRRLIGVAAAIALYGALTAGLYRLLAARAQSDAPLVQVVAGATPPAKNVTVRDGGFLVDGQPFVVKAVGWDPVRPGELPWQRKLAPAELESDLARIAAAGFNAVRTWASLSPEELALVAKHRLRVLQGVWVPPDGDFSSPRFRRQALAQVRRAVEGSRWSPAILGYLVMNEPRAPAVARAGLERTRAFLSEVTATVRALDPSAPIGYASWPGVEALDDSLLDFVAFNLYPHRPRVVMQEFGLRNYVRMLRETVARGRPLLISEFGVSVSPGRPLRTPGRGGATEAEQAQRLRELAADFLAAGAAGTSVFQWSDGWWKNNDAAGDELTHDPHDPEEWFGLVRFEGLADRRGRPRPALAALADFQRTVLLEPRDGRLEGSAVRIRLLGAGRVRMQVGDGPLMPVRLRPLGPGGLHEGWMGAPPPGVHTLRFEIADAAEGPVRVERRVVAVGPERGPRITVTPSRASLRPGETYGVAVRCEGPGAAGRRVIVTAFSEDRTREERVALRTDAQGRASARLRAPEEPTLLTLVAFDGGGGPAEALRAGAWAALECRENP
jgi:hypothetical protein